MGTITKCFRCCNTDIDSKDSTDKPKIAVKNNIVQMSDQITSKDLIVDDSDPNRVVIKRYLLRANRLADEAINGENAIEIVKNNGTYNIIWMDIQMPRMNGIKCAEYLRNVLGYKGAIIGLTGHVDADSINNCKKAGMQDVLAKPIDKKILEMYIDKYKSFDKKN